ncbi:MAG: hypothetical protein PUI94_06355 [Eubacteriales bacterium]|nr:hypothetical protein [Eubacteriales bacterium]
MEQIRNAGEIENAQTAAAEEEKGVVNDKPFIGKFASVDALYKAYERLEAEFTRRSQRLKALEAGAQRNTDETTPQGASPDSCDGGKAAGETSGGSLAARADGDPKPQAENKPDGVFSPGGGEQKREDDSEAVFPPVKFCRGRALVAPPVRPRTLAEAGELAKIYLKSKGEF